MMIPLNSEDRRVLALSREYGVGDGFTVPANVPGEPSGSCSFANVADIPVDEATLPLAQLVGIFAFERARSEEHTSELQSLMRISYAVFCLKKKTKKISQHTNKI